MEDLPRIQNMQLSGDSVLFLDLLRKKIQLCCFVFPFEVEKNSHLDEPAIHFFEQSSRIDANDVYATQKKVK